MDSHSQKVIAVSLKKYVELTCILNLEGMVL